MDRRVDVDPGLTPVRTRAATGARSPAWARAAAIGAAALVGLFVVWPAAHVLHRGAGPGVLAETLGDARIRRILGQTIAQAAASTGLAVGVGLAVGIVLGTWEFPGRRIVSALMASPFALPSVVVGASFLALLPERFERGWGVIVAAHVFYNAGMVARTVGDAWAATDPRLDDAAATLGASPAAVARTLLLPQVGPTLGRLAGLVGALSLGTFGIALVLGGPFRPTTEVEVWRQSVQLFRLDRAAALALVQLVLVGSWLWFTSRSRVAAAARQRATDRRRRPDARFARLGAPLLVIISALIMAPMAALLMRALHQPDGSLGLANFRALAGTTRGSGLSGEALASVGVSLRMGVLAASGAVAVAVALAAALPRLGPRTGRLLETVVSLPLAVSSVALGLGFLLGFARPPLAWRASWWLIGVAQAVVAVPFAVRIVLPAAHRIDPSWRAAAATLGAAPWRCWWTIERPLLMPAIGAGAAIAGAIALGDLGASSFLSRPSTTTVPVAIVRLSGRPGAALTGQANALAVILGALTIVLAVLSQRRTSR